MNKKYQLVKNVLGEEACMLLATEMKVYQSIEMIIDEVDEDGVNRDKYIPNAYGVYAGLGNESLLLLLNQKVNEVFGKELDPTYTYARIYKNGSTMLKHIDRLSCEYSLTLCLQKDKNNTPYPIYIEGEAIDMEVGDAVFYKGCEVEHWRNEYEGEEHIQVFLHYTPKGSGLIYDGRPFVGFPNDESVVEQEKQHKQNVL